MQSYRRGVLDDCETPNLHNRPTLIEGTSTFVEKEYVNNYIGEGFYINIGYDEYPVEMSNRFFLEAHETLNVRTRKSV